VKKLGLANLDYQEIFIDYLFYRLNF
jgi:hypothetical protein